MTEHQNFETYKRQLFEIIKENPDYWLADDKRRSWKLYLEWIDRYRVKLGILKEKLSEAYIPTMDTLIRRLREIKESPEMMAELRRQKEKLAEQKVKREQEELELLKMAIQ